MNLTHHRHNVDEEIRHVQEAGETLPQPRTVEGYERDKATWVRIAYQAAHSITIRMATADARLAMITTKRRISRWRVVRAVGALAESVAMRPL